MHCRLARMKTWLLLLICAACAEPPSAPPTAAHEDVDRSFFRSAAGQEQKDRILERLNAAEAFEKFLATGRAAFVPRMGARPREVFERIHEAGGVASLAHPALVEHDEWIPGFAAAGLDALEAYHSDHDEADTARYLDMADRLGLKVSGGSDFHGDESHGPGGPGSGLPRERFDQLKAIGVR